MRLAALFSPANVLLFLFPGKICGYRYYSLFGGRGGAYAEIPAPEATAEDIRELRNRLGCRPEDVWGVGLPLNDFFMVNLQLPLAARDDLDQAVQYALMRHLPFDVGRFAVSWMPTAWEDKHIKLTALAIPRHELRDSLGIVDDLPVAVAFPALFGFAVLHGQDGLYMTGDGHQLETVCMSRGKPVFQHWAATKPEQTGVAIDEVKSLLDNLAPGVDRVFLCNGRDKLESITSHLGLAGSSAHVAAVSELRPPRDLATLPGGICHNVERARQRDRRLSWLQGATLAVLLLSIASIPAGKMSGKAIRVNALEQKIDAIRPEGEQVFALRDQNENTILFLRDLEAFLSSQTRMSDLLLEATLRLPSSTWLTSLNYSGQTLRIQGLADSAATVIEALENSPRFREVRLESQVTKSGDKDTFHISASLEF
ncbi:MAG: hypothetical protein EA399_14635 [Desulfovibrionales bacterium]|nr:MAG: hypothetical protein EA399_14635 [Desulfovibrionales bacterium]